MNKESLKRCIVLVSLLLAFSMATKDVLALDDSSESLGRVLSLVEFFHVADTLVLPAKISFRHAEEYAFLSQGWKHFTTDADSAKGTWINSRNAVVEVPLVAPTELVVELDIQTFPKSDLLDIQRIQVLWNGHPVRNLKLDWGLHTYTLSIPKKLQRHGPNRMELLPAYWLIPQKVKMGNMDRPGAALVSELRFKVKGASGAEEKRIEVVEDTIRQRPQSAITYYFTLPKEPRFRATLGWMGTRGDTGKALVVLRDVTGKERIVFQQDVAALADAGEVAIDVALDGLGGEMVSVGLHYVCASPRATSALAWRAPRIEGKEVAQANAPQPPLPKPCNIFVILFDALRADDTAPYGGMVKTPQMARLANEGVTFLDAMANASWTRPSVTSLFTSLYAPAHNVITNKSSLPQGAPYLPEILKQHGFRTLAIPNNGQISPDFGFDRGFDEMHKFYATRGQVLKKYRTPEAQAQHVWEEYIDPFLKKESGKPFFVYLHEEDPHWPYEPPPPYDTLYGNPHGSNLDITKRVKDLARRGALHFEAEDGAYLRGLYRGEISFMDAYLGWMLDRLEAQGLRENTLVVFLSDHGEEFLEHGSISHGHTLYDELLRVPLIMSLPSRLPQGHTLSGTVELVDFAPTILDMLGYDIPEAMQGSSLVDAMRSGQGQMADKASFARVHKLDSVTFRGMKLITHTVPPSGWRFYALYNLQDDPGETINRWPQELIVGKTLEQMLNWQHLQDAILSISIGEAQEPSDLSSEVQDSLKALGYL